MILDSLFRKQERDEGFVDGSNLRTLTLPWSTQKDSKLCNRSKLASSDRFRSVMQNHGISWSCTVMCVAVVDNVAVKSLKKASKTILGFSVLALLTFLDQKMLCCEAVPCVVGCLAASLVTTHKMPVAFPLQLWYPKIPGSSRAWSKILPF